MIIECIVTCGILFAMQILLLKSHKTQYAIVITPLLIVPAINILAKYISEPVSRPFNSMDEFSIFTIINVIALVVSCVLIGVFSNKFKNKHAKVYYLLMCIIFNILFTSILIYRQYVLL